MLDTPTIHGRPMPRPITAAWLVMPPRSVKTARAACIPRMSSGDVSRRTKMQSSSREALACASAAVKTNLPVAAPGLAAMPWPMMSRMASESTCRCNNSLRESGSIRINASWREMILSSASATAIRTAAREDRGIRTPSRICNSPLSTVNSNCISSRNFTRIKAA